jgi:hypothetical protein
MDVTNTLINEFFGVIFNVLLFSIIPLAWYLIRGKSTKGFFIQ